MQKYVELYSEIKKGKPKSLRGFLRNAALTGLAITEKLRNIEIQLSKPRIQFIYIHHLFKDEESKLHELLRTLQKHHTFITYSEAVEKIINCSIDKPYIVISSDDGFRNNLRAARILDEYNVKGCFFINPSIVSESDYDAIAGYCKTRLHLPPVEFMNWNDINELQKSGHEIGSHTMDHLQISQATSQEIIEDMGKTFALLLKNCGEAKHFAYPYGRYFHFNDTGRKACFDAGFISCASAERGCHINHSNRLLHQDLCILRDHVILDWDINHILYFFANNARNARTSNNLFPYLKQDESSNSNQLSIQHRV